MSTDNAQLGSTIINIDLTSAPVSYPPARPGVRKGRIVSVEVVAKKAPKVGFNMETTIEFQEPEGKTTQLRNWAPTDNQVALVRMWLSAGLKKEDTAQGVDTTLLVGRDVVVFIENTFDPDPVNIGQTLERSNIKLILVPTDSAYTTAQ